MLWNYVMIYCLFLIKEFNDNILRNLHFFFSFIKIGIEMVII